MSKPTVNLSQSAGGLRCAAVSDVGMRRTANQDDLAVSLAEDAPSRGGAHLVLVADGMGAHAAGELASKIAAENIPHVFHKGRDLRPWDALVAAVQDANSRIFNKGQNSVDFHGMGTTCSCLLLAPEGAIAAHVGDSRIYRLRGTAFEQLTFDHSLVWEMAAAGQAAEDEVPAYVPKNVITRSLGPHATVKVDVEGPLPTQPGDRYLLCSDGLTGPLDVQLIGMVLAALPPDDAAQTLVDLANLSGGPDNITAVVAELSPTEEAGRTRLSSTDSGANGVANRTEDGAFGAAVLLAAVAAIWMALRGMLTAALATAGIGLAAAVAWAISKSGGRVAASPPGVVAPFGKAPYRHYEVAPSAESIERLSDIVRQLEDLEDQRQWPFDWSAIHEDRGKALRAISLGDYRSAVVAYSSAVRRLMQAVRQTRTDPTAGSGINLGMD